MKKVSVRAGSRKSNTRSRRSTRATKRATREPLQQLHAPASDTQNLDSADSGLEGTPFVNEAGRVPNQASRDFGAPHPRIEENLQRASVGGSIDAIENKNAVGNETGEIRESAPEPGQRPLDVAVEPIETIRSVSVEKIRPRTIGDVEKSGQGVPVDGELAAGDLDALVDSHGESGRSLPVQLPASMTAPSGSLPLIDGLASLHPVDQAGTVALDAQGNRVYLSFDANLQLQARALLQRYNLPWSALVALDPRTGRVLAMASYSEREPFGQDVATRATFPAASLFKLVTAAAAIEQAGLGGNDTIFYRGGDYTLGRQNALPDPRKDRRKISFAEALGRSVNPAFARVAVNSLSETILEKYAQSFGFNQPLPFDIPVDVSHFERPADDFETARTGAGFGPVFLSPIHAAVLTATIANRGLMMKPILVDRIVGTDGRLMYQSRPTPIRTAILGSTASELLGMMQATVDVGTARRQFVRVRNPFLRSVPIAAKTGTLSGTNPRGLYHWFVAAVPANKPEIAIAALIIDPGGVRIRCSALAREFLEYYFRDHADTLQTRRELVEPKATL